MAASDLEPALAVYFHWPFCASKCPYCDFNSHQADVIPQKDYVDALLDDLEQDKADEAALEGKKYSYILQKQYRWESWAAPKDKDGEIDHNRAMTGDDLVDVALAAALAGRCESLFRRATATCSS